MTKIMIAALAAALVAGPAFAVPWKWTLSGATFSDGGTASGSFVYDADTNTYSAVNITTTAGTLKGGAVYIAPIDGAPASSTQLFVETAGGSAVGQMGLWVYTDPKTNAGGTLAMIKNWRGNLL